MAERMALSGSVAVAGAKLGRRDDMLDGELNVDDATVGVGVVAPDETADSPALAGVDGGGRDPGGAGISGASSDMAENGRRGTGDWPRMLRLC
jgi:hypothetical protein